MKRGNGYFFVKRRKKYEWVIGSYFEGMWRFIGDENWYSDWQLAEKD